MTSECDDLPYSEYKCRIITLAGAALLQVTDRVQASHVEIRISGAEKTCVKSAGAHCAQGCS